MITAYVRFWKNYANFNTRSSRSDYWWAMVCQAIIGMAISLLLVPQIVASGVNEVPSISGFGIAITIVYIIFLLASLIPSISVVVRRLHDTGRSGWWYFIQCVPCFGAIIMLVYMCLAGTFGPNKYGEDPKTVV